MAQHRTMQDVYALITAQETETSANSGGESLKAGDEVIIQHRTERLEEFGWISEWEESDRGYRATLTPLGAAVINYAIYTREGGTFGEELESGVHRFINKARRMYTEGGSWRVVEMEDDQVVLENQYGKRRMYELVSDSPMLDIEGEEDEVIDEDTIVEV